jgi:hypothetical protein
MWFCPVSIERYTNLTARTKTSEDLGSVGMREDLGVNDSPWFRCGVSNVGYGSV